MPLNIQKLIPMFMDSNREECYTDKMVVRVKREIHFGVWRIGKKDGQERAFLWTDKEIPESFHADAPPNAIWIDDADEVHAVYYEEDKPPEAPTEFD